MTCKKCGNKIPKDSVFCTSCGEKIEESPADVNNSAESEKSVQVDAAAPTEETNAKEITFSTSDIDIVENSGAPAFSNEPTITEQYEKTMPRQKIGAGRMIGAAGVSILAIIFLILFNLLFCTKIGLNNDIVKNTTSSMNSEVLMDSFYSGDDTVADYIYNSIDRSFIASSGAEKKDIRSILVRINFLDFAADKLQDYADALINGNHEGDPSLSSKEIQLYLEEHDSVFFEELNYPMTVHDYEVIAESFEKNGLINDLSINTWNETLGFSLWNIHFAFSFITIAIAFALIIVLFIWIIIILDKNKKHIFGFLGSSAIISGIITFLPSVAFLAISAHAAVITGSFTAYVASHLLLPSSVLLACTGLFEIIAGIILKKIKKVEAKKKQKAIGE